MLDIFPFILSSVSLLHTMPHFHASFWLYPAWMVICFISLFLSTSQLPSGSQCVEPVSSEGLLWLNTFKNGAFSYECLQSISKPMLLAYRFHCFMFYLPLNDSVIGHCKSEIFITPFRISTFYHYTTMKKSSDMNVLSKECFCIRRAQTVWQDLKLLIMDNPSDLIELQQFSKAN